MSDPKPQEKRGAAWSHDVKLSLEPLRDGVLRTREQVVKTMEELNRQIERHKASIGRFSGR